MSTTTKMICIYLCVMNLSACMTTGQHDHNSHPPYDYQAAPLYPEGYDNTLVYDSSPFDTKQEMVAPNTYPLETHPTPLASKDMDKTWVNTQNPSGYTIQISDDEKAAHVAGVLQKAPKNERMAEVKYQHDGRAYYKGLYGSFPNAEAANKALDALPNDIKQGARIETWGSVQQRVTE